MDKNTIDYIDMLEPIRLGYANMIYEGKAGFVFEETRGHALMIAIDDLDVFIQLYNKYHLNKYALFAVKQKEIAEWLILNGKKLMMSCYTAVYTKQKNIMIDASNIALLDERHIEIVCQNYHTLDDHDYHMNCIHQKRMWGIFDNNELAGFIGIHDEGSIGMLEVLEKYRRKGYGYVLEAYLINEYLKQGWIPYGQIIIDNDSSLALQKKLGLVTSTKLTYWLN